MTFVYGDVVVSTLDQEFVVSHENCCRHPHTKKRGATNLLLPITSHQIMKVYGTLLTLCVFVPVADAFVAPAPKALTTKTGEPSSTQQFSTIEDIDTLSTGRRLNSGSAFSRGGLRNRDGLSLRNRGGALALPNNFRGRSRNIWDEDTVGDLVQGGSLRTWSFKDPAVTRVKVLLKTEGRPLNANVDLWHGPDNTPQKIKVYLENGLVCPFSTVIETPRGQNSLAIRNTAQLEFPLEAAVEPEFEYGGLDSLIRNLNEMSIPETIQGGALRTYSFAPAVSSVQVLLTTDGRPLNARIELLQGPNNNKQTMEVYTENGMERPFFIIVETPDIGNVVRVVNTAPMEFPLEANVEPFSVGEYGTYGGLGGYTGYTGSDVASSENNIASRARRRGLDYRRGYGSEYGRGYGGYGGYGGSYGGYGGSYGGYGGYGYGSDYRRGYGGSGVYSGYGGNGYGSDYRRGYGGYGGNGYNSYGGYGYGSDIRRGYGSDIRRGYGSDMGREYGSGYGRRGGFPYL